MKKFILALALMVSATSYACIPGSKVLAGGAITLWAEKIVFKFDTGTVEHSPYQYERPQMVLTDVGLFVIEALEIQLTNDGKNIMHTDYKVNGPQDEEAIYRIKSNYMADGGMTRSAPRMPDYPITETIGCGQR
ncbi:MAG: hypothetical protein H6624_00850 [Bdellovibrionaceae bacterium]|nr:hypothetical protein [Bdellovibrionales bacterium]MCB9082857.1 hypothetical protein [Pseudobdellovibrionaceae bacterium]